MGFLPLWPITKDYTPGFSGLSCHMVLSAVFCDNTRVRVAYECVITRKLHEIPYGTYTTGTRSVTLFSHVENDNKSTNLFKINTVLDQYLRRTRQVTYLLRTVLRSVRICVPRISLRS